MITVHIRTVQPMRANRRNLTRWLREGLQRALIYWHRKFLPFHFTTYAYARYPGAIKVRKGTSRYRDPATGEWRISDKRPLYESGLTRAMATTYLKTSGVSAAATTKFGAALGALGAGGLGGTVWVQGELQVPAYLGYLKSKGFDVNKELTVMNATELREMGKVAFRYVRSQIEVPGGGANIVGLGAFAERVYGTRRHEGALAA